ncbi:tetratricopeptide repeat protein [candidate division KSB1 bacterium]|nr:tetratricopeptide repeat protein [candidate division KSB1 bacterium]
MRIQNKLIVIVIISVFMISLFAGCSQNYQKEQAMYNAERMFYKANKLKQNIMINPNIASPATYQEAELAYREVINQFATTSQSLPELRGIIQRSWITVAELYVMQKQYDKAISVYQEIINTTSFDKELCALAQYSIGSNYERLEKVDDAIAAYNKVIENYAPIIGDTLLPNMNILQTPIYIARLYRQKNDIYQAKQQYTRARNYYQHISQKYPNSVVAMAAENQIAVAYGDEGEWGRAVNALQQIIQQYEGTYDVFGVMLSLANTYQVQLKDAPNAIYFYDRLISSYPENPEIAKAYLGKGNIKLSQKLYNNARENFQAVLNMPRIDNNSAIQAQLAIASSYEMEGNWQKALNEYQWVINNFPKSLQSIQIPLYIADHYAKQNEVKLAQQSYENAIQQYQHTIDLYPNTPLAATAQDHMAMCYIRQEKWSDAIEALTNLSQTPIPPQSLVNTLLTLGSIYEEKLSDYANAISSFKAIITKFPDIPVAANINARIAKLESNLAAYQQNNTNPMVSNISNISQISENSVEIKWTPNLDSDFQSYQLYRSLQPGVSPASAQMIAEIKNQKEVQFLDTDVTEGEPYYYKVVVSDRGGLTSTGNEKQVATQAAQFIANIQLQGQTVDWSTVNLIWNEVTDQQFDSYKIYRSTNPGVNYSAELIKSIYDAKTTSYQDDNVMPEKTYYYKIFAANAKGEKQASNEIQITTTRNSAPSAVILSLTGNSNNSVELSWQGQVENDFSMYRIYRSDRSPVSLENSPLWMSSNKMVNSYKDSGVTAGKTYYYKVVVYDKGGLYTASNEIQVQL